MPFFSNRDTTIDPPAADRAARHRFDLGGVRAADLYDAWMFAEADAALALAAWRSADRADKPDAHAAYVAALDREAHAANLFEYRMRGALSPRGRAA
jgi:hypothetical protein